MADKTMVMSLVLKQHQCTNAHETSLWESPTALMFGIFHQGFDAAQSDTAMTFTDMS